MVSDTISILRIHASLTKDACRAPYTQLCGGNGAKPSLAKQKCTIYDSRHQEDYAMAGPGGIPSRTKESAGSQDFQTKLQSGNMNNRIV